MAMLRMLLVGSVLVSLACLAIVAAAGVILALRAGGRRETRTDDHDALSESRFTIPVSAIVRLAAPLQVSIDRTSRTIEALLALNYPQHEVIVLVEQLAAADWDVLKADWQLEAREFFYRQSLETAAVRMVYRSARDTRLMVVEKEPAGVGDALNCGVNLARFRYVGAVDAGVGFDQDALLRAMTAPMRDPANVVGAANHLEAIATTGVRFAAFHRLASIRSMMQTRLVWRRLRDGFAPRDAIVVWRREALIQSGGFSDAAADPALDMMVRLQTSTAPGIGGQIVRGNDIFGHAEPRPHGTLMAAAQSYRASLAAIAVLARAGRPHIAPAACLAVSELLIPLMQAWLVAGTTIAAIAGWLPWRDLALIVIVLSFGRAMFSATGLILRGSHPGTPDERTLVGLLLTAPAEFAIAAPAGACARAAGIYTFLASAFTDRQAA